MQLVSSFSLFKFGNKGLNITFKKKYKMFFLLFLMYILFFKFYLILMVNIFLMFYVGLLKDMF